jgi:hypothetical protein
MKGIDGWHASGANDAVDRNDGLLTGDGVVTTPKNSDFTPRLPTNFVGSVVNHSLFQRDPRLGQALGREFQNLQSTPP